MYQPELADIVRNVDLLYHEATFAESEAGRAQETFHTTASQAARLAKDADVKRLLIGHYSARYDDESILIKEACEVFPNTVAAKENLCITL